MYRKHISALRPAGNSPSVWHLTHTSLLCFSIFIFAPILAHAILSCNTFFPICCILRLLLTLKSFYIKLLERIFCFLEVAFQAILLNIFLLEMLFYKRMSTSFYPAAHDIPDKGDDYE